MEGKIVYDINKLMDEVQTCYDTKCYFAALSMSLILPDICSKIEYKLNKSSRKYYKKWCTDWLSNFYDRDTIIDTREYWSQAIYKLRCDVLHNAENKFKELDCIIYKMDEFEIYVNEDVPFNEDAMHIGGESYSGLFSYIPNTKKIKINLGYFIYMIMQGVTNFANKSGLKIKDFPVLELEKRTKRH